MNGRKRRLAKYDGVMRSWVLANVSTGMRSTSWMLPSFAISSFAIATRTVKKFWPDLRLVR
jgi:hypothetical protein